MPRLSADDRIFFRRAEQAAYSNPFGARRDALDRELAEVSAEEPVPDLIERVIARVEQRVQAALRGGAKLEPNDRTLVEHALLFVHFHQAADDFDALIDRQVGGGPTSAPFAPGLLSRLVSDGFTEARSVRALELFYQMRRAFRFVRDGLIGDAPSMHALRASLWNQVFTSDVLRYERFLWNKMEDFGALIVGETGSGKGAAAAALGRSGFIGYNAAKSSFETGIDELFVAVNLSEYSASLLESELFGHKRGAFTGAIEAHEGVFDRCSPHGVIFLDEVGELSDETQVKLLRVLQERTYSPVGSRELRRFAGRVVAATHQEILGSGGGNNRLRQDFYYRLASDVIEVPSLRTRLREAPTELPRLVGHILARLLDTELAPQHDNRRGVKDGQALAEEVTAVIERDVPPGYRWPGNVRELEQAVRRVLLTGAAPPMSATPRAAGDGERIVGSERTSAEVIAFHCSALHELHGTYEKVSRITGLDRRTVKKYVLQAQAIQSSQ